VGGSPGGHSRECFSRYFLPSNESLVSCRSSTYHGCTVPPGVGSGRCSRGGAVGEFLFQVVSGLDFFYCLLGLAFRDGCVWVEGLGGE
jgi:hypothetical protein